MASTNRSGTFFYSPDIKVYVQSTALNKTLDLTQDVTDFNIDRSVNATSTASITLANPDFKYTPGRKTGDWNATLPIETMDKIIIYLKRVKYLQVFSGYITLAPILTLIPQPVQIQAHCTLYTVQNTFWDPNVPENQQKIERCPKETKAITSDVLEYLKTLEDGSVENIFTHHFLEHAIHYEEILNESSRVLKKGGIFMGIVPAHDHVHSVHHVMFESPYDIAINGFEAILADSKGRLQWEFHYIGKKNS